MPIAMAMAMAMVVAMVLKALTFFYEFTAKVGCKWQIFCLNIYS